jgi:hypothetical protein
MNARFRGCLEGCRGERRASPLRCQPRGLVRVCFEVAASDFDENDAWHSYANLFFAFHCVDCMTTVDMDLSGKVGEGGDEFLAACVEFSRNAQRQGWASLDPYNFVCPTCAMARKRP